MSNIFTQSGSPSFTKQSISEYFVDPMFMGEDIRGAITVRTDIKGTERLNKISRPSMITKPKIAAGFNPAGSFELTTQDITVKPMAIEFEQNGREFWGSIVQQLLASGYKEDDVEQMKNPDIWNKIILPIIAEAGQQDLIRQMWFADPELNLLDSHKVPTGVLDENYSGYNGFFSHFIRDLANGTIPASQAVDIALDAPGTKHSEKQTFDNNGFAPLSIDITINGRTFSEPYNSAPSTTVSNWLVTHKATIESLWGTSGITVEYDAPATLIFTAKFPGAKFLISCAPPGGPATWTKSDAVIGIAPGAISQDGADAALEQMLDNMLPEMLELDPVFLITRSMWRNLFKTWKSLGTETANIIRFKGVDVPVYENIPILIRPDWDKWITVLGGIMPHRAILAPAKNLLFATDGTSDSEMVETWYNQDLQKRRYRVQYKAQTAYLHKELLMLGGLSI